MRRRALRIASVALVVGVAVITLAWVYHYQLRLRTLVGAPVVIYLSKGAWVDCDVSPNTVQGQIESVSLTGIVVRATKGSLTHGKNRSAGCEDVSQFWTIAAPDTYYVRFRALGGVSRDNAWLWRNPFAT